MKMNSVTYKDNYFTTPLVNPHGFFTRGTNDQFNISNKPFASEVQQNINQSLRVAQQGIVLLNQVHGQEVIEVTELKDHAHIAGDALFTTVPNIIIGVKTADCVPILLEGHGIVAAVHAGWRPVLAGVIENCYEKICSHNLQEVRASIGPCIRQDSYEVSQEVLELFLRKYEENDVLPFFQHKVHDKYHFDLAGMCLHRLSKLGIKTYDIGLDTLTNADKFFSYRRDSLLQKPLTGCQFSGISLNHYCY